METRGHRSGWRQQVGNLSKQAGRLCAVRGKSSYLASFLQPHFRDPGDDF